MTAFELDEAVTEDEPVSEEEPAAVVVVPPVYESVTSWVEHSYSPIYIRKITQTVRWCPQWWAHPEAVIRLTALWRTWESARASDEDAAMADWLRTYFDAINPVLLSTDGPFHSCTLDRHAEPRPLPVTTPPPGHWDTDD